MIPSLLAWFTDPANWSGPDGIPARLLEHLQYTLMSLVIAAVIAIPLGLWVGHTGRARWLVSLANSLRAVPTLGLLFAVALWLGPKIQGDLAFTVPSILVLSLLAIPPMLAGTYAGIEAVDPAARDAAQGHRDDRVRRSCARSSCRTRCRCSSPASARPSSRSWRRRRSRRSSGSAAWAATSSTASRSATTPRAGGAVSSALLALVVDGILALAQRLTVSPGPRPGLAAPAGAGKVVPCSVGKADGR